EQLEDIDEDIKEATDEKAPKSKLDRLEDQKKFLEKEKKVKCQPCEEDDTRDQWNDALKTKDTLITEEDVNEGLQKMNTLFLADNKKGYNAILEYLRYVLWSMNIKRNVIP